MLKGFKSFRVDCPRDGIAYPSGRSIRQFNERHLVMWIKRMALVAAFHIQTREVFAGSSVAIGRTRPARLRKREKLDKRRRAI